MHHEKATTAPALDWRDVRAEDRKVTKDTAPVKPDGTKQADGQKAQRAAAQSGGLFNFGGTPKEQPPAPAPSSGWRRFVVGALVGGGVVWIAREVMR